MKGDSNATFKVMMNQVEKTLVDLIRVQTTFTHIYIHVHSKDNYCRNHKIDEVTITSHHMLLPIINNDTHLLTLTLTV